MQCKTEMTWATNAGGGDGGPSLRLVVILAAVAAAGIVSVLVKLAMEAGQR